MRRPFKTGGVSFLPRGVLQIAETIVGRSDMMTFGELALAIWNCGAVKIDTRPEHGFELHMHRANPEAEARRSPIYLNLRTPKNPKPGPLTPELVDEIGRLLWHEARDAGISFDGVAGIPNAGEPFAEAFVQAAEREGKKIPLLYLQEEAIDGKQLFTILDDAGLDPVIDKHQTTILLIDDVFTGGTTKELAVEGALNSGFLVTDILVVVDRRCADTDIGSLRALGIERITSVVMLIDLVEKWCSAGLLSHADRAVIVEYLGGVS